MGGDNMSEIKRLINDIEKLRESLSNLIHEKEGDLLDKDVLNASKMLNVLIVEYNKIIDEKLAKHEKSKSNL